MRPDLFSLSLPNLPTDPTFQFSRIDVQNDILDACKISKWADIHNSVCRQKVIDGQDGTDGQKDIDEQRDIDGQNDILDGCKISTWADIHKSVCRQMYRQKVIDGQEDIDVQKDIDGCKTPKWAAIHKSVCRQKDIVVGGLKKNIEKK